MNLNGGGPQINPAPQPTVWGFDTTPDGKFVVLVKQTVGGTSVDFIDVDT
jgi:hypothetical protein